MSDSGKVILCRGARRTEARLLEDLRALHARALEDPALLASPVLVVASAAALRAHLVAKIPRVLDGAALGVRVATLWGVAREILDLAGERAPRGGALYEVLVRRAAKAEGALEKLLDEFDDGYAAVAASVRDFLSAGFEPDHEEALLEALSEISSKPLKEKAAALVRVAAATARVMAQSEIGRGEDLLARATRVLLDRPELLRARATLIAGFADATGRASDFLQALLRIGDARLYLDEPPDPANPARKDLGARFSERFRARLLQVTEEDRGDIPPPARVRIVSASGAEAEARECAYRTRELLAQNVSPRSVGVVVRFWTAEYALAVRKTFGELGVPLSGETKLAAGFTAEGRRRRAALGVWLKGREASLENWLEALGPRSFALKTSEGRGPAREDLHLFFRAEGLGTLSDAAAGSASELLGTERAYKLPARAGIFEGDEEEAGARPARRRLAAWAIEEAFAQIAAALEAQKKWTKARAPQHWAATLEEFLAGVLGWERDEAARWLEPLSTSGPDLDLGEALSLLSTEVTVPLGGRGGGVRVMDATAARALTFEHLFVLGLNRGVFPRVVKEDPLLPDRVRQALLPVLCDLPLKAGAADEERYLFAQLLSSAPHVTLSYQRADAEGKARPPSPLLERLLVAEEAPPKREEVPRLLEQALCPPWAGGAARPRPPRVLAQLAGLAGTRKQFAPLYALCLETGGALLGEGAPSVKDAAAARLEVLEEYDPGTAKRRLQPSPYFGFVGALQQSDAARDPRAASLYVTTLERLARCPWQAFLSNVLGVEPPPEQPLRLPVLGRGLIGEAVHRALAEAWNERGGVCFGELSEALAAGPQEVKPPSAEQALKSLREAARTLAREQGARVGALHAVLERLARPFVERAVALDRESLPATVHFVGSELVAAVELSLPGGKRTLRFKADRVHLESGRLVLSDLKTGRPVSEHKTEAKRREKLLQAIAAGERLQAAAYSLAAWTGARGAAGRYVSLSLHDGVAKEMAVAEVDAADEQAAALLPEVVGRLIGAWEEGVFPPRLENPKEEEPAACAYCEFFTACVRHDSGMRRRIVDVATRARDAESKDAALSHLASLWWLGTADGSSEEESA